MLRPRAVFFMFCDLTGKIVILSNLGICEFFLNMALFMSQPSECGRQRTLNIVHAQTDAQQQSNGSYEARMSGKCGEWRD